LRPGSTQLRKSCPGQNDHESGSTINGMVYALGQPEQASSHLQIWSKAPEAATLHPRGVGSKFSRARMYVLHVSTKIPLVELTFSMRSFFDRACVIRSEVLTPPCAMATNGKESGYINRV
jgi:hypothetical protein